jgi:hypothetical protein
MDNRRKIQFYLSPDKIEADKYVCDQLESIPQGDRGRVLRAVTLAGFALQKIEGRIPFLLSELLNENTTREEVIQILKVVLPPDLLSELQTGRKPEVPGEPSRGEIPADKEAETRNNAKKMF